MSIWTVRAIERLGAPDPARLSHWGPAEPGTDPIAANDLHTVDLSGHLVPLRALEERLEAGMGKASLGSLSLDMLDPEREMFAALGPGGPLSTSSRYCGPWIELTETWPGGSARRWLGYLDPASLEWEEESRQTRATALHVSQLVLERRVQDMTGVLRPWPSTPAATDASYTQATGDQLMDAWGWDSTIRTDHLEREQALWAQGKLSWRVDRRMSAALDLRTRRWTTLRYPAPPAPSTRLRIAGQDFPIEDTYWTSDSYLSTTVLAPDEKEECAVVIVSLIGAPDLRSVLAVGTSVTFAQTEAERTHYLTLEDVAEPESGTDGPKVLHLDTVDQLVVGDRLTLALTESSSGKTRETTEDVVVVDLDAEANQVHLLEPLQRAIPRGTRIRRNDRSPVMTSGVSLLRKLVAPWPLDTVEYTPPVASRPVLSWLPHDSAVPALYGVTSLHVLAPGVVRLARRGPSSDSVGSNAPIAGVWEGPLDALVWRGAETKTAPIEVFGNPCAWPETPNAFLKPPALYVQGDLTAGETTPPPNGWAQRWRSLGQTLDRQYEDLRVVWRGDAPIWGLKAAADQAPAPHLCSYSAGTGRGLWAVRGDTWTWRAHSIADGVFDGVAAAATVTGTVPAGNWLDLGLGIVTPSGSYAREGLLGLRVSGSAYPWTTVQAVLFSTADGVLTVVETQTLQAGSAAGPWALGGGLAVNVWRETLDGIDYPHSRLHLINGTGTVVTLDLAGVEVLPGTLVPLALGGDQSTRQPLGWYGLALETYATAEGVRRRRARFLHFGADLRVLNGNAEVDPRYPAQATLARRIGDVVAEIVPDGTICARMARLGVGDDCVGLLGGRLFCVSTSVSPVLERVKIEPDSSTDVQALLESISAALGGTVIPERDGSSVRLVSKTGGTLRQRVAAAGASWTLYSATASETSGNVWTAVPEDYASEIRVRYQDAVLQEDREVVVDSPFQGGKPVELDLGDVAGSQAGARAYGEATASLLGLPRANRSLLLRDLQAGQANALPPVFWSEWRAGDRIVAPGEAYVPAHVVTPWKVLSCKTDLEDRSATIQIQALPGTVQLVYP